MRAIDALVHKGCSPLALCTIDSPKIRRHVNEVIANGTPVITVNTDLSDTDRLCYVGSDYYNAGKAAGGLFSMMSEGVRIRLMIITGHPLVRGPKERDEGFMDAIKEHNIDCDEIAILDSNGNNRTAYEVSHDYLEAHPEINSIFISGSSIEGVMKAVQEYPDRKFRIIVFDDVPSTRYFIKKGLISFTICQEPMGQGYEAMKVLQNIVLFNEKDPRGYTTDNTIKIKENMPCHS